MPDLFFLSRPCCGPFFHLLLSLLATVGTSSHYHTWLMVLGCSLGHGWFSSYTCTHLHSQPQRVPWFSPHDEVGLVNVPSTFAVVENATVAHHRALLQGQLQRVVLGRRKHAALLARAQSKTTWATTKPHVDMHRKQIFIFSKLRSQNWGRCMSHPAFGKARDLGLLLISLHSLMCWQTDRHGDMKWGGWTRASRGHTAYASDSISGICSRNKVYTMQFNQFD